MPGSLNFALVGSTKVFVIIYQSLLIILTVLCLDLNNDNSIELTDRAILPKSGHDIDVTLTGYPRTYTVMIDRVRRPSRFDQLAFCFHNWCFSVLMWRLEGYPKPLLYKLARTLVPNQSMWEDVPEGTFDLDSANQMKILASYNSERLFISNLPAELRSYIWQHVGLTTPYSVFILVSDETCRLACCLRSISTRNILLERDSPLSASMVTIFGVAYIQGLIVGVDRKVSCKVPRDVIGVKYVTSLSGICAIKLLGNGRESDWLGKIPCPGRCWYGLIRGRVARIHCVYNVSQNHIYETISTNMRRT